MRRLPFSIDEYQERLKKIRHEMVLKGLDVLILTKPDNICYLSGYGASTIATSIGPLHALVVPVKGEPRLITRLVEEATVVETQWTKEPKLHADHEDPFDLLVEIIEESGNAASIIGVEKSFLTATQMERIKQVLSDAEFKDATGIVESVSVVLSKTESDYVRKAAEVTNVGFWKGVDVLHEGIYVYEVVGEIHNAMYKAGQADLFAGSQVGRRTPWIGVWAGPRGGLMHDTSTLKKLEKGDLVTIEIWGTYNHYMAFAQGTVFIGDNPPPEIINTYKMVSDMYVATRDAIRAGVKCEEPYHAANKIYRAYKGADYFRTLGFSMGLGTGNLRLFKGRQEIITPGLPFRAQAAILTPFLIVVCATVIATETGREEVTRPLLELMMKTHG